jgi:spore germination protein YaaH
MKFNSVNSKIVSLVTICLLLLSVNGCGSAKKPFGTQQQGNKPKLQVMAFYEKGWNELTFGLPSLKAHYKDVSVLMPYWYTLRPDGSLKVAAVGLEPDVISFMGQHREIKLMPLVNKDPVNQAVLANPTARTTAINNLVKQVEDNRFDGVNIDFELLPANSRDDLTVFIRDLATELHNRNKMISASVMPKLDGLEEIGAAYDYGALGQITDYITLMTYDKHNGSSDPGSVSPYSWVENNIKEALKEIPADKLVVCIGAYGYDWPVPEALETKYIGMREALQRADSHKAEVKWDDESQSAFFSYWDNGVKHDVWFENGFSVTRKVALAKKYGLRGVAIWRMGFEDEQYWAKLDEALNK